MKKIKLQKNQIKDEKGAVTLFVLATMMFFLVILIISYARIRNEITEQDRKITTIQKEYNSDDIDERYNEALQRTNYSNEEE